MFQRINGKKSSGEFKESGLEDMGGERIKIQCLWKVKENLGQLLNFVTKCMLLEWPNDTWNMNESVKIKRKRRKFLYQVVHSNFYTSRDTVI